MIRSSASESDLSDREEERESLIKSILDEISKKDKEEVDSGLIPIEETVNLQLNRFYESVRKFVGDVAGDLLKFEHVSCDDIDLSDDEVFVDEVGQEEEESVEEIRDICKEDLLMGPTPSIEDLLKDPDFAATLDEIDDQSGTQSLMDLVEAIKTKIENLIPQYLEHVPEESPPEDVPQLTDEENLKSEEFVSFFKSILDVSRAEMKDIFEGDDDLVSTKEFQDMCLEVFKKVQSGTLDTCDEMTGAKFVLCPVKDSFEEVQVTDEECQRFWNSLHLKSYYKCIENNLEESQLVEPLHRLLMIGKFTATKSLRVKKKFDKEMKVITRGLLDEVSHPTGALILFESFFFHVVEGGTQAIDSVIEATAQLVDSKVLQQAKVIETIFEIPNRYYNYWKSAYVKREERPLVPKQQTTDEVDLLRKVKEFREKLRILASYIQTVLAEDFEIKIQLLMPLTILPEESELNYLFEDEFFLTAQQHVDKYFKQQIFTSSEEYECPPVKKYEICL